MTFRFRFRRASHVACSLYYKGKNKKKIKTVLDKRTFCNIQHSVEVSQKSHLSLCA